MKKGNFTTMKNALQTLVDHIQTAYNLWHLGKVKIHGSYLAQFNEKLS